MTCVQHDWTLSVIGITTYVNVYEGSNIFTFTFSDRFADPLECHQAESKHGTRHVDHDHLDMRLNSIRTLSLMEFEVVHQNPYLWLARYI